MLFSCVPDATYQFEYIETCLELSVNLCSLLADEKSSIAQSLVA